MPVPERFGAEQGLRILVTAKAAGAIIELRESLAKELGPRGGARVDF